MEKDYLLVEDGVVTIVSEGDPSGLGARKDEAIEVEHGSVVNGATQNQDGSFTPPPIVITSEDVVSFATALKVKAINFLRIDNGDLYPETLSGLEEAKAVYRDIIDEFNLSKALGEEVTAEQEQVVLLIRQGYQFFKSVDEASKTIIEAGDVATPIEDDVRWPTLTQV